MTETDSMRTLSVGCRLHVVRSFQRPLEGGYPKPNYNDTGYAFCGVLRQGESLDQFKKRWSKKKH